ncbi:MAG: methyltransferase domain-containing protein [Proteobacteria bacterium]|nr:methyltransferase domain-containing protein [Pseudomonadota bacterium]
MQYPAQIQAATELLAQIESSNLPADRLMAGYFRPRRYIGSKDKKVIAEAVYAMQRGRGVLAWAVGEVGLPLSARSMTLAWLVQNKQRVADIFTGAQYQPEPLDEIETKALPKLIKLDFETAPADAEHNYPAWLEASLKAAFGLRFADAMQAMNTRAPLDLRANTLKINRDDLMQRLRANGVDVMRAPHAPDGLRVADNKSLFTMQEFKDGLFEVQDEGSQIAARMSAVQPGMKVIDFCAGAGGKTLALAAMMGNKGRLQALDVADSKLKELRKRIARAGVDNVNARPITNEWDAWLKRQKDSADVVLVDAPCSGSGTWRRNPDSKWRLTPQTLQEVADKQRNILHSASRLVKHGGRLVYITCSVLPEENQGQIDAFLADHKDFTLVPVQHIWKDMFRTPCPTDASTLQLAPHTTGTDGFFIAILQRGQTSE